MNYDFDPAEAVTADLPLRLSAELRAAFRLACANEKPFPAKEPDKIRQLVALVVSLPDEEVRSIFKPVEPSVKVQFHSSIQPSLLVALRKKAEVCGKKYTDLVRAMVAKYSGFPE